MRLARLFLYPVKSLRGIEVESAEPDALGLVGNRCFFVVHVRFRVAWPGARCIVTTAVPRTGEWGVDPLRTLSKHRRDPQRPTEVLFGQNVPAEDPRGTVRVGDLVAADG